MSKRRSPHDESQEQSDLEISVVTGSEAYGDEGARKKPGLVGRLFRLPWLGSEPAEHDRGRELRRAVRAEDIVRIRKMLKDGVGVNESQEASLACIATRRRNLDLLQVLIEAGVDLNQGDRRNRASHTRTPLQEAARKGWLEGIDLLIRTGKLQVDAPDDSGATALMLAVRAGKIHAARRLLQAKANPNGNENARMAPMHEAATPEMAQLLLAAGASLSSRDKSGAPPLLHQARAGRLSMVDFLLDHGEDINATDFRGRTALFCPGVKGEVLAVFQRLVERGAKTDVRDQEMNTFAHLAATRCVSPKVLEWVYENSRGFWNVKNQSGETPLDIIRARGFQPLATRIRADLDKEDHRDSLVSSEPFSVFGQPPRG